MYAWGTATSTKKVYKDIQLENLGNNIVYKKLNRNGNIWNQ